MDITESLKEIFYIRKEIQSLTDRLNKKKNTSQFAGDVVQNGYKGHAYIYGVDIIRKETINKLETKYNSKIDELNRLVLELTDQINNIPFSEIRQIFHFRYIDNLKWFQVANEMNKLYSSEKYTEDSVRCKHDRYLEKNYK